MSKWQEIEKILKTEVKTFDETNKYELIEKLSIYHEELELQNEELRRINENLEIVKNDYQDLFESSPIANLIINEQAMIVEANESATAVFGEVLKKSITTFVFTTSQGDFFNFLNELFDINEASCDADFIAGKTSLRMKVMGKKIGFQKGHYLISCVDFEKQYRSMEKMNMLTYRDHLTGLYNRRYFEKTLYQINQHRILPFSIIMGDVNGLKVLNDAFGHIKGDELLKKAADLMQSALDTNHIIARVGGDEFAILLPNTTSSESKKIMNELSDACSNLRVDGIQFSISFGTETIHSLTEDVDDIVNRAENRMYSEKLIKEEEMSAEIVESIMDILYQKYPDEKNHSEDVAKYMKKMGKYLGYDNSRVEFMGMAGRMHNIGKVVNDNGALDKASILSSYDMAEIRKHPEVAYRILKSSPKFSKVAHIILYQHEWVDGRGYPKGLSGMDIPYMTKILSVCEAFSAMTTDRPYRAAMTKLDAIAELEANAGIQFDESVIEDFVDMLRNDK